MAGENDEGELLVRLEDLFISLLNEVGADEQEVYLTRNRGGIFSSALTMFLMVCQRAFQRQTLVGALEALSSGAGRLLLEKNPRKRRAAVHGISLNSGGYSRARNRLSLEYVRGIVEAICSVLIARFPKSGMWRGRHVYLMDGTTISLAHSKENREKYPSTRNQYRESHTSEMICSCVHSLLTGVALAPAYGAYRGPKAIGEIALGKSMISQLPAGGLVIADRGFSVFSIAHCLQENGSQVLVRLTTTRADGLLGTKVGTKDIDEEVVWRPSKVHLKKNPDLSPSAEVRGRLIKHTIRRQGFRPLSLLFFSNSPEPASDLAALYQKRECIENDIRTLKYTIGLEMLHSRTPEMLHKELLLGVMAYNLLRAIIATSAAKLGIEPRQISFSRAAALVVIFGSKMLSPSSDEERRKLVEQFLVGLRQSKLPNRSRQRIEPRKVVRKRNPFPLMKTSRSDERKVAMETLKKHGHRGYFTTVSRKP